MHHRISLYVSVGSGSAYVPPKVSLYSWGICIYLLTQCSGVLVDFAQYQGPMMFNVTENGSKNDGDRKVFKTWTCKTTHRYTRRPTSRLLQLVHLDLPICLSLFGSPIGSAVFAGLTGVPNNQHTHTYTQRYHGMCDADVCSNCGICAMHTMRPKTILITVNRRSTINVKAYGERKAPVGVEDSPNSRPTRILPLSYAVRMAVSRMQRCWQCPCSMRSRFFKAWVCKTAYRYMRRPTSRLHASVSSFGPADLSFTFW